jgi:hypothetical protein
MKPFLLSVIVAVTLAIAAAALLNGTQQRAYEAYATSGTRVSDPGHNLVGPRWSGEPSGKGS